MSWRPSWHWAERSGWGGRRPLPSRRVYRPLFRTGLWSGPRAPAWDMGTGTLRALSGRLAGPQDGGPCPTAGVRGLQQSSVCWAPWQLQSGAFWCPRDLTYDLSHLPLSRPSLGEDACPDHVLHGKIIR